MDIAKVINLLNKAKMDHYWEPEGIRSCPKASCLERTRELGCDCGADELNAEIDAAIAELSVPKSLSPVDVTDEDVFEVERRVGFECPGWGLAASNGIVAESFNVLAERLRKVV